MTSPRTTARIAGVFYLLVFVTGMASLTVGGRFVVSRDPAATAANILSQQSLYEISFALNLLTTASYIVVTALFYELFLPVSRSVSLTAALFSTVGCAISGVASIFQLAGLNMLKAAAYSSAFNAEQFKTLAYTVLKLGGGNVSLVFFGFYCGLVGFLILRSTFLPRIVGAGMLIASAGWLTFLAPSLVSALYPYNLLPGIAGEGLLTVWLLARGVNAERWKEQSQ